MELKKMKSKILSFLLLLTSLIGYLEWSGNSHMFLFQAEGETISKLFTDTASVLHPFILIPMIGQIMLTITVFQKKPTKILIYLSIGCLGLLLGFMFVIGLISLNYKIILSTIPFIIVSVIAIKHYREISTNQVGN
jgi:hypothetical protein